MATSARIYRGRLAPTPSGPLHFGHARTFWIAHERCRAANGAMVCRIDDLDRQRSRPEFVEAALDAFRWLGFRWEEGPVFQSERHALYVAAFEKLRKAGFIYPCFCTRKQLRDEANAPHDGDEEPLYSGKCRHRISDSGRTPRAKVNWRFAVPAASVVEFDDVGMGRQRFVAGQDFGDFVVWKKDNWPSYQLATVVDDAAQGITEVVRGRDLLLSTARQILLYGALGFSVPTFFHAELVCDAEGKRLAKRDGAESLESLRCKGANPEDWFREWRNLKIVTPAHNPP